MPGNIAAAVPSGVFPQTLSTLLTETRVFPLLTTQYHDSNIDRAIIVDGVNQPVSLRGWKFSKRLDPIAFALLETFYVGQSGGLTPFYFYDPFAASPPGANFDPTGVSIIGRETCVFRGGWNSSSNLARTEAGLEIAKIA